VLAARDYLRGRLCVADLESIAHHVSPRLVEAWIGIWEPGPFGPWDPNPNREFGLRLQEIINASQVNVTGAEIVSVDEAVATATRDGIAGLTPVQLLIVVLVWLLALGTPLIQETLPPEAQQVVTGDIGTAGLALAITTLIIQQRRR